MEAIYLNITCVTQGLYFYGLRSQLYPSKPVHGIVITARCDLAQSKVNQVHYLTAITLNDWIKSDCLYMITKSVIKSSQKKIITWMQENKLNSNLLEDFGTDKIRVLIAEYEKNTKRIKSILNEVSNWEVCNMIMAGKVPENTLVELLNNNIVFQEQKHNKMELIIENRMSGYYLLPGSEIGEESTSYIISLFA